MGLRAALAPSMRNRGRANDKVNMVVDDDYDDERGSLVLSQWGGRVDWGGLRSRFSAISPTRNI